MSYQPDDYSPPTGSTGASSVPPYESSEGLTTGVRYEPADEPLYTPPTTGSSSSSTSGSTTDTATEQAKQVKDQAVDTTKQVAGVAADQAQNVAAEAKAQARNVVSEARQQLTDQASTQQNNLASWLFDLVEELRHMVDGTAGSSQGSPQSGVATSLVRQASDRAHSAATWLQDHEPQDLLAETGRFARRRPGTFLALALAGGVLAGRVTRGLTADSEGDSSSGSTGSRSVYAGASQPVTYGTGPSVPGSGPALPAASGYLGAEGVDTVSDVETYGDVRAADTYADDTYTAVAPVEEIDPLRPGGRRDLDDDAGLR